MDSKKIGNKKSSLDSNFCLVMEFEKGLKVMLEFLWINGLLVHDHR